MTDIVFKRIPQDDDELWEWVATVWGFHIPREAKCPNHQAPFDAFADAFFARHPVTVWKASRGLGGKSTLMGILAISECVLLGAQVTILGGSAAQSQRVHEVTKEAWYSKLAPKGLLMSDPTTFVTRLKNGAWITALMASQTSVRGPHPQRLRLDEIDEMELAILEAAQGQPMDKGNIESQTVMSSTHQYPDKTMTEILRRAGQKGWPVMEWCYKDNLEPDGWLTARQVDKKKEEVSESMWAIEFDLQEPSTEGRVMDTASVERAFDPSIGVYKGDVDEEITIEEFEEEAKYVTGVDWAKEQDWSILVTYRADCHPWRCVAWRRVGRLPWPILVSRLDDRLAKYGGLVAHDATGLGNVVGDLISYDTTKVTGITFGGAPRKDMFSDYIKAIEGDEMLHPRIEFAFTEHKYAVWDDVYGRGHPPDSFVAGALAWSLRRKVALTRLILPSGTYRDHSPWKMLDATTSL